MPNAPQHEPDRDRTAGDADARRVMIDPAGPLLVEGPVEIALPDGGTAHSDRFMVALCTCHRSADFPWCDTSHRRRPCRRERKRSAE
ncbi:CDGSH iron-sulfur domain-containing protein [Streptomyces xiaopingdaonensis]|uniref:CDGSH iron-sulfur domain-containing protein n=1 Tax=Streptomyces xiaopingdaonensis TaxID=1565415 RepID=UPI0002DD66F9|nr:CDGSH iron-sulfur domain-containing protein [Streptomyces xiaopingdaonensis]